MNVPMILAPVFVQVALVFVLLLGMSWSRTVAIRDGGVPVEEFTEARRPWPARARQVSASYANQFELPVLFFALVPLALLTRKADWLFVSLEWLFVLARIVQAAIHTTSNNLSLRGAALMAGAVALALAWVLFGLHLALDA